MKASFDSSPEAIAKSALRRGKQGERGNQHVNDVRRSVRDGNNVPIDEIAPTLTTQPNAMASLELRDLERALVKLPQEQREVILLVGLEGMRYEEVAEILSVPTGTVRSRLSRGRDQLRMLMGEEKKVRPAVATADLVEEDQRAA